MKKLPLCLFAAIAVVLVGCTKKEAEEDDSKPAPSSTIKATTKAMTPRATSVPADWMWKNSKGKVRDNDPLKVKDDPLDSKPKK